MGEIYHNYKGIDFYIYSYDNKKHKTPHIHAYSSDGELVICLKTCTILSGNMKKSKQKYALKWVEEHRNKLLDIWDIAIIGGKITKIK